MIETTDFNKSEQYTLSIRLSTDGFSFSVSNPLENGEPSYHHHQVNDSLSLTANVRQIFRELEWLNRPYRNVNVLMADRRFAFIPLEFFEDEQIEIIFHHNHPKLENELIQYNILQKSNIVVLFGMNKSTCTLLNELFANVKYYSQASPLIEYFATKSRLGDCRKMYVSLQKEHLTIYCYQHGQLLFANSFSCKITSDRIYYILYAWKMLGFEQERDELHLTSNLPHEKELLPQLRKYIQQVFVMNSTTNIDLQALTICE